MAYTPTEYSGDLLKKACRFDSGRFNILIGGGAAASQAAFWHQVNSLRGRGGSSAGGAAVFGVVADIDDRAAQGHA